MKKTGIFLFFLLIFPISGPLFSAESEVKEVLLEINGATNIILGVSENGYQIKDVSATGSSKDPIKIEEKNGIVKIISGDSSVKEYNVNYRLFLPEGIILKAKGSLVNISGRLNAKELKINSNILNINADFSVSGETEIISGVGSFNIRFEKSGPLFFKANSATGLIKVPKGTTIKSLPTDHQALKIIEE